MTDLAAQLTEVGHAERDMERLTHTADLKYAYGAKVLPGLTDILYQPACR